MNTESAQLPVTQRVALALSSEAVEKEFRELAASSASITAITNPASYDECHAARMRLVKARTTTARRGKSVREDATAFAKGVISEEARLVAIIQPEETRLQALQGAEDAKREAKIKAEMERSEQIQAHIRGYTEGALAMAGKPAAEIARALDAMRKVFVGEWAMEFKLQAQEARDKAIATLEQLHAGAVAQEAAAKAEADRIAAEREELARLRADAAKRDAEAAELAKAIAAGHAAERAQIEAEQKAAAAQIARENAAAQAVRDRADAEAKAARDEADRIAREEAAKVRAAQDAEAKRILEDRNRIEAERREVERQQNEIMEGGAVLTRFVERFGKRREFAGVVKAIDAYMAKTMEKAA